MKRITVTVIEDNRLLREGITALLEQQADMRVVSALGAFDSDARVAPRRSPRVVLFDLGLRDRDGARIMRAVRNAYPGAKMIGMGLIPTQQDIVECVQAGAAGFVLKDATVEEFLATIRLVASGGKVVPPQLTGSLFACIVDHALARDAKPSIPGVRMTRREREIVVLIAEGMSNKEIARRLSIAAYTVKSHVHNILEKLALHSRLQIALHARTAPAD